MMHAVRCIFEWFAIPKHTIIITGIWKANDSPYIHTYIDNIITL